MNEFKRNMALYFYEEEKNKNSWADLEGADVGELSRMTWSQFEEWLGTKKLITRERVVSGLWKKAGDHGHTFIMRFLPDGTYLEHNMKTEKQVEHGRWEITGFARSFKATIISKRQGKPITFTLEILGDTNGNYAGVENKRRSASCIFYRVPFSITEIWATAPSWQRRNSYG